MSSKTPLKRKRDHSFTFNNSFMPDILNSSLNLSKLNFTKIQNTDFYKNTSFPNFLTKNSKNTEIIIKRQKMSNFGNSKNNENVELLPLDISSIIIPNLDAKNVENRISFQPTKSTKTIFGVKKSSNSRFSSFPVKLRKLVTNPLITRKTDRFRKVTKNSINLSNTSIMSVASPTKHTINQPSENVLRTKSNFIKNNLTEKTKEDKSLFKKLISKYLNKFGKKSDSIYISSIAGNNLGKGTSLKSKSSENNDAKDKITEITNLSSKPKDLPILKDFSYLDDFKKAEPIINLEKEDSGDESNQDDHQKSTEFYDAYGNYDDNYDDNESIIPQLNIWQEDSIQNKSNIVSISSDSFNQSQNQIQSNSIIEKISKTEKLIKELKEENILADKLAAANISKKKKKINRKTNRLQPILTENELIKADEIIDYSKDNDTVISAFKFQIKGKNLRSLSKLNWLDDEIMNYYMAMITNRSENNPDYPKVWAVNTFFYTTFRDSGYDRVRRWSKRNKIDIFSLDYLIVPIHLQVHWTCCVIDIVKQELIFYDSMGPSNGNNYMEILCSYLEKEHLCYKTTPLDNIQDWKRINANYNSPQQNNGSDCGVFTCCVAENISRCGGTCYSINGWNFDYTQMPYIRKKMIIEIINKQIFDI